MRALIFLCMTGMSFLGQAQDPDLDVRPSIPGYTQNFEIPTALSPSPIHIEKDGAGLMVLKVVFNCRPSTLTLAGPGGQQIDLLTATVPNGAVEAVLPADTEPEYPACMYTVSFSTFPSGSWTLVPGFTPFPGSAIHGTYQVIAPSPVAVLLAIPRARYPIGETIIPALYVGRNGQPISGVQIDAKLARLDVTDTTPQVLNFADDGSGADDIAEDGNYHASLPALVSGQYAIWVTVQGQTTDGPFFRTVSSQFRVYRSTVIIGSTIEDRPIAGPPK